MDNVVVFEHPLIQHKISLLRDKNTGTNEFRQLVDEIAMLEGFEALSDLPVEDVEIETPIEKCMTPMIAGRKLAVVPILRAGLGMVSGILALVPSAEVGHIGSIVMRKHMSHRNIIANCRIRSRSVLLWSVTRCWQQVVLQWMRSIRSRNMVARTSSLCALLLPRRDWSDYTKSIRIFRSM